MTPSKGTLACPLMFSGCWIAAQAIETTAAIFAFFFSRPPPPVLMCVLKGVLSFCLLFFFLFGGLLCCVESFCKKIPRTVFVEHIFFWSFARHLRQPCQYQPWYWKIPVHSSPLHSTLATVAAHLVMNVNFTQFFLFFNLPKRFRVLGEKDSFEFDPGTSTFSAGNRWKSPFLSKKCCGVGGCQLVWTLQWQCSHS